MTIMKNMGNFTCWHIYGIIMNKEKDYDQARRCYLNALKFSENNTNVMKDLSVLQIMVRDFEGFEDTRRKILIADASQTHNWACLAIALQLTKKYADCKKTVDNMIQFHKENPKNKLKPYQMSETVLLGVRALEQ
jgi:peptide alpha-N-acetyltransferase